MLFGVEGGQGVPIEASYHKAWRHPMPSRAAFIVGLCITDSVLAGGAIFADTTVPARIALDDDNDDDNDDDDDDDDGWIKTQTV
eukprot:5356799-Amphidinium_carterae.2